MKKIYKVEKKGNEVHIQTYKMVYQNDLYMVVKTSGNPQPIVVVKANIHNLEKEENLHWVLDFIYKKKPHYYDVWCSHHPLRISDEAKQEYFIAAQKKEIE
jgi:GTP:adenosylcobinamide-phosphate guanylyltransferase